MQIAILFFLIVYYNYEFKENSIHVISCGNCVFFV